jgi:16S rRNA (cytosine1402-N4)-methyltransferase
LEYPHQPVLLDQVVEDLAILADGIYVDGTVGTGGHSLAIAQHLGPRGHLLCLDRDTDAVTIAKARLSNLGAPVTVVKSNYAELDEILHGMEITEVQGVLLDLGLSSLQLEHSGRGFSFHRDEPLDMRMDENTEITARELVNERSTKELEAILRKYGEEPRARAIARTIVREREERPIESSLRLARIIESVLRPSRRPVARHPATRAFQALRIAVNQELENLRIFLSRIPSLLARGGRFVVLSYHSLEDRPVKQALADWERGCICPPDLPVCACGHTPLFKRVRKKGKRPSPSEIAANPRARSAILRAAERI